MITLNENTRFESEKGKCIFIHESPVLGSWGGILNETMKIEAPVSIGRGFYDIGFIGSGTFINISILRDVTTHCVIDAESIGRFCCISHNVHIGFPEHSTSFLSPHPLFRYDHSSDWCGEWFPKQYDEWEKSIGKKNKESYSEKRKLPQIGNDVWIGYDVKVLNGVKIGNGSVIAAGAVVTKDVAPYCIVGGVPARVIKRKFSDNLCERLEKVKWWEYGPQILHGLAIDDPIRMIGELEERTIKHPRFVSDSIEFHIKENYALHYDAKQNIVKKYEF